MTNEVHEHQLPNGLKLLGESNPANKSATIGFFVKTGARDETKKEAGVSHFLEHMMFKGTAKRSALEITYELGNLGAQANAFTSEENTVYYAAIVPDYFPAMQELLSDMLRPAIDVEEYRTEKKVILEEIALYQDRPQFYLYEHAIQEYFGSHPAGNSVLGTSDSITALERDEMKSYFDRRYSPSNLVLVATGNFDWKRFVDDAGRYCGHWVDFKAPRTTGPCPPKERYKEFKKKGISQSHVVLISEGPAAQDDDRYAFSLLSMILGDSSGSRLYWALVDKGIAEAASAENDDRDGTGCFLAYAVTEPERLDEVVKITREILSTPAEFSDADLERAKTKLLAKIVLNGELPMGRLMALGTEWNYRERINSLKETIEKVKRVDRKSVMAALERFPIRTWSEFRLLPE